MLTSIQVNPLGENYKTFLETNNDGALGEFLQGRLERYRDCVHHIAQTLDQLDTDQKTNGRHILGLALMETQKKSISECEILSSFSSSGSGIDALVDALIAIYDDTKAVAN